MCGVLFCLVSFIVKKAGTGWLDVLFPPAAMGAIVAVIGLELAGVAAGMAGLLPAEGQTPDSKTIIISITTLAVTVLGSVLFRGFLAIIPILIGVLVGYALSFAMGIVDTTPIINAHWFALPTLYTPRFEWFAILTILPAALVVIAEHVGHLVVTANIVKKDLLRDPGLHRSMFANGLSTVISGFFGSTPNTTYGENIGVMAITRVYSTWVIGGAAIFAILLSCVGKLAGRDPDDPTAGDGRRFAAAVWRDRRFRYSRFDRVESGLQQSAKPDPDFGDFDHRRQWREGSHRRGGAERHGAGDHRRCRPEPDFQSDQRAAP